MSLDQQSTALFGGSFHPPHLGHTQAIEGLLRVPGIKNVIVLPSFGTPLKKVSVSPAQRLAMAKLAFTGNPLVEVSDFELQNQTQFTWQVLEKLSSQIKNLVFVIGTDQFEKLEQWEKFPEVLGMCNWVVILRKPRTVHSFAPTIKRFVQDQVLKPTGNDLEFTAFGKKLLFVATDAVDVSSTWLREKLAVEDWSSVKDLIAPNVKDYILRNKLYGN